MSKADVLAALLWVGITAYALLGGADFGGGVLDLFARGERAERQRLAIQTAMGPVWEANHVWLIFFLTGLFSVFPLAFETLSIALYLPLLLALVGIVLRGAAFAFRGHFKGEGHARSRLGRLFGIMSVLTPVLFGATAGALAVESIRYRGGDVVTDGVFAVWLGPFQLACGGLALAVCSYLAATYLTVDMTRAGEAQLAEDFRGRALAAGTAAGALSVAGLVLASAEAERLYDGLTGEALPLVVVGVLAGAASLAAVWTRRFKLGRALVATAVIAVLWSWAIAQHPRLVGPDVTIERAAAADSMQTAFLITTGIGAAVLAPALWLLYVTFRRESARLPE